MARALARSGADPDDLVQLAVERALAHRDQWRPGTRLDSWVFTIMKRAWIDEGRAAGRRNRVVTASTDRAEAVADPTVASFDTRMEARSLAAALEALPDEQRLAVVLVLVEGLSYAEAAAVLEVPVGTLTSRLGRGRQALVARMNEGERP
jgi:RNA polymerase sigma-70 factor (ECF subfamily)